MLLYILPFMAPGVSSKETKFEKDVLVTIYNIFSFAIRIFSKPSPWLCMQTYPNPILIGAEGFRGLRQLWTLLTLTVLKQ